MKHKLHTSKNLWTPWRWPAAKAETYRSNNKEIKALCNKLVLKYYVCNIKVKVKGPLAQALRLCTGRTAHRGSRGIALLFLDHSTRRGWGVSVTPRPLFTSGKDPVPIVQEAGWAPGPVWTGAENLAPTVIRSPDRPARSQSLYRLSYPAHMYVIQFHVKCAVLNEKLQRFRNDENLPNRRWTAGGT